MSSSRRAPLVSCSPWALLIVLLFAAAFAGWRLAAPLLRPLHDPAAAPRAVTARGDLAGDEAATIELFKQASPSVVHIRTTEMRYARDLFRLRPLVTPKGSGSGFVWDEHGTIVTNFHVVLGADHAYVFFEEGSEGVEADYVGGDPDYDIAVLRITAPGANARAIPVGTSKDLQVGQKVFAIGNPFGLDHTLTSGVISGLDREILSVTNQPIRGVIQTDAAINPGNSGGPLLDSAGRLIGMNTAIASATGENVGIGFAVPVDTINRVVPSLIRTGRFTPPRMGVRIAPPQVSRSMNVDGLVVQSVDPGSGADRAGLRSLEMLPGGTVKADVILAVDGQRVSDLEDLERILGEHHAREKVKLEILRDGRKIEREVELQEGG